MSSANASAVHGDADLVEFAEVVARAYATMNNSVDTLLSMWGSADNKMLEQRFERVKLLNTALDHLILAAKVEAQQPQRRLTSFTNAIRSATSALSLLTHFSEECSEKPALSEKQL